VPNVAQVVGDDSLCRMWRACNITPEGERVHCAECGTQSSPRCLQCAECGTQRIPIRRLSWVGLQHGLALRLVLSLASG
jgi:predicted amidophosphoribosyltransferase